MMRNYILITSLLLVAACTYDPNSGDGSFHPLLLSRPSWDTVKQNNAHGHICSVTAGDLQVTLGRDSKGLIQQVAPGFDLHPGDTYSVQLGSHHYETVNNWFGARDSDAMIQDFLGSQGNVYTELHKLNAANHDMQRNNQSNKIPLAGFAGQYQVCKDYVQSAQ